ncbi:helix-turn-helix transcriptional regulator [Marivibrio halodurans]|uniref:Helix-turn-helix transcriptional regulator n=1 Tax=Marivibrio halodurans TaxID=2039722 RepID=A0A8J7SA25_9PROT|nr:helix-turn-helix transcriptional regulator [Marivibrio halodurans]MBP5858217.1 helix-turn-helix transcriptional regulator [Marivibrio halodurans]
MAKARGKTANSRTPSAKTGTESDADTGTGTRATGEDRPVRISAGRPGVPNPIDIHVGGRVRLRRTILGMSQERLGEALGLTFQQVQKYERGTNRIGASRLYDLSRVLDVPIAFFYEDMDSEVAGQSPRLRAGLSESAPEPYRETDPMARRETLELIRAYYKVKDVQVRKRILDLCKSMAHSDDEG